MTLFRTKTSAFDISTAEFVFFYIDNYKMFKKQGFCLTPQYKLVEPACEKNEGFIVKFDTKKDFIDLFEDENINVIILCGKNGCGKSTLLKLLADNEKTEIRKKTLYILKDKNGNFASSSKCRLIIDNKTILLNNPIIKYDFIPSLYCLKPDRVQKDDRAFIKNITNYYAEYASLFDSVVDGELFTHFVVEIWNFDEAFEELLNGNRRNLFSREDIQELKSWLKSDFLSFYILLIMQNRDYDNFIKEIVNEIQNYKTSLREYIENFIYMSCSPKAVENLSKSLFKIEYKISEMQNVENLIDEWECKIFDFLKDFGGGYSDLILHDKMPREYLYFRGFTNKTKPCRYLSDLSNGEYLSLKYRYDIFSSMSLNNGFWWFVDEPEKSLHPEWCRTFLNEYLEAYKSVKKYLTEINKNQLDNNFNPNRRYSLIFATHSPFLLSDVTNDYVIYLQKQDGERTQVFAEKEVFAGNIGEMYNTSFFMQNTIGEFSRSKIMEIITSINNKEKLKDKTIKKWKMLISKIGDDLLRNLLTDKVECYEKNRVE